MVSRIALLLGLGAAAWAQPAGTTADFNAAIKIADASGDTHLLAAALGGLGASLANQAEYVRAEPVLRRSLALFEKTSGPDSLETAEAANNLAMVYRKTGELAQAQAQLTRALPVLEAHLDPHCHELSIAFNNMFILLAEQKQWDQAEPYLRRALAIARALPESPDQADIEQNLALLQAHRGHFEDAAESVRRAIAIEERTLGPEDARLAPALETYAAYLRKIGHKSEARKAEQRARQLSHTGL